MKKYDLFSALDTMLIRTIADIDEEWGENDTGRKMKERIRQAYKQMKEIINTKEETLREKLINFYKEEILEGELDD